MTQHAKQAAIDALPSVAAIVTWLAGIPVEKWAATAGLVFIVMQCIGYLWRLRRDMAHERERYLRQEPPPPRRDAS